MSTTLLLPSDVAREIDRSVSLVRDLDRRGVLPAIARTPAGIRLYDPATVRAYLRARDAKQRQADEGGEPDAA